MYELALGPLALAFCGASDKDTIAKIQGLEKKFGPTEWIHPYLASRGLRLADYQRHHDHAMTTAVLTPEKEIVSSGERNSR